MSTCNIFIPNIIMSAAERFFSKGLKNKFETAVVKTSHQCFSHCIYKLRILCNEIHISKPCQEYHSKSSDSVKLTNAVRT